MSSRRPTGHRRILLRGILIIGLLLFLFLPGPNGLINIISKEYRVRQYRRQIRYLKVVADSLEQELKIWQNPDHALKFARRLFRQPPVNNSEIDN